MVPENKPYSFIWGEIGTIIMMTPSLVSSIYIPKSHLESYRKIHIPFFGIKQTAVDFIGKYKIHRTDLHVTPSEMLLPRKSCCCYSLQHGTVVIGIVFMVGSAVALLMEVGLIGEWRDIKLQMEDEKHIECKNEYCGYGMIAYSIQGVIP